MMIDYLFVDIDECVTDRHNCDLEATCFNTDGGFFCECNAAFTGNGTHCEGKSIKLFSTAYAVAIIYDLSLRSEPSVKLFTILYNRYQ